MTKRMAITIVALATIGATASASFAQDRDRARCKPVQSATGWAHYGDSAATNSAVASWRRAVILKYGERYSDYVKDAKDKSKDCGKTMLGLQRCEVRGAPCEADAVALGTYEEACESGDDANRCVRVVKWVRRRLKAKGYYTKEVDGIPGEGTVAAVRKYKRANRLGDNDDIDDTFLKSLGT